MGGKPRPNVLPRPSGFTLLETLVALVITALASVLIVQGLAQALMLRDRVLEHTQYQREDALRRGWFGDTVSTLVADLPRIEQHRFVGTAEGFRGLTLAALQELPGLPTVVEWRLEREGDDVWHLYYRQSESAAQRSWSWRAEQAEFAYFDPTLGWHAEWPPAGSAAPALPAAVSLTTHWRGRPLTWVAAVRNRRDPRPDLELPQELR